MRLCHEKAEVKFYIIIEDVLIVITNKELQFPYILDNFDKNLKTNSFCLRINH
jgi:hypothetical protein